MTFEKLLAKSRPPLQLQQHLADVYVAAQRVLDATQDDQLRALGLSPDEYRDRFRRIVLLAAAVHDLGKANDHFQGMIWKKRDVRSQPQGLRHEWVGVVMLNLLRECLLPAVGGREADLALVEWAVAGHHPAHDHASPPRVVPPGAGAQLELLCHHPDFRSALKWLNASFALPDISHQLSPNLRLTGQDNVFAQVAAWYRQSQQHWDTLRNTREARFVAAAKSTLIAADVAGSALPKVELNDADRWQWITDSFAALPEQGDLQAIVSARQKTFTEVDTDRERFQKAVAASTAPVTFVKAGCGTGKTQAAYLWAAANHPTRRLYFCYPTTGTATEGFRDYLFEPDGLLDRVGAKLFHSRRIVDEIILTGQDMKSADLEAAARLESLEAWSTPVVVCTVDTVLGLVQNNKRGLYAWPALAQSALVFDEIHAYDDRLFGALLRFLRDLPGLPALLMTASLPKPREDALRETLKRFRDLDLSILPGPTSLETLPRYHEVAVAKNDPLPVVQKTLADGGKVLWVCNTVGRVKDDATKRAESLDLRPLVYHSRFKYEDRVKRHGAVIQAFKSPGPALAICSQVAEMSLDLSADLLVTDLAPVPSLIQRLGRLNRRAKSGDATKPFIVIEPDTHMPYTPAGLEAARAWLQELRKVELAGISQHQLAVCWEQSAENPPELVPSAWLDGGPSTTVVELREASPGISVLMESDAIPMQRYDDRIRVERRKAEQEKRLIDRRVLEPRVGEVDPRYLARFVLPMPPPPRSINWHGRKKYRGLALAPPEAIGPTDYDPERGAKWAQQR